MAMPYCICKRISPDFMTFQNKKSVLFPERFDTVVVLEHNQKIGEIEKWIKEQGRQFKKIFFL